MGATIPYHAQDGMGRGGGGNVLPPPSPILLREPRSRQRGDAGWASSAVLLSGAG